MGAAIQLGSNKLTQVWSQPSNQWVMYIMIIIHNRSLDYNRHNPGSCAPSRPKQSTSSSMRICELKSNMQEHRLITSQWWKLLTDARETTNNSNGPQGTTGTIYGMWTVSWRRTPVESLDRRPMMKTSCRMRRTCHWGMQAPRYHKESLDQLPG